MIFSQSSFTGSSVSRYGIDVNNQLTSNFTIISSLPTVRPSGLLRKVPAEMTLVDDPCASGLRRAESRFANPNSGLPCSTTIGLLWEYAICEPWVVHKIESSL